MACYWMASKLIVNLRQVLGFRRSPEADLHLHALKSLELPQAPVFKLLLFDALMSKRVNANGNYFAQWKASKTLALRLQLRHIVPLIWVLGDQSRRRCSTTCKHVLAGTKEWRVGPRRLELRATGL